MSAKMEHVRMLLMAFPVHVTVIQVLLGHTVSIVLMTVSETGVRTMLDVSMSTGIIDVNVHQVLKVCNVVFPIIFDSPLIVLKSCMSTGKCCPN